MKKILVVLMLVSIIFATSFCKSGGDTDKVIKVGIVTWGGYIAGLTANGGFATKAGSIYDKLGIKVKFVVIDDFDKCRAAFRSGDINVMWGTVDAFSLEYNSLKALNPVAILQNDWSRGGDAIAVKKGIETPADLKGKTIAVAEATPSHYYAIHVIKKAGLSINDVKWVFVKSAVVAANSFKSGSVDACVSWAPDVYQAAKAREGAKILSSTKTEKFLIADILIARKAYITKNMKAIKAFIKGWFKGVVAVNNDREAAAKLMTSKVSKGFTGVDLALAKIMLDAIYLPTYEDNVNFFNAASEGEANYHSVYKQSEEIWKSINKLTVSTEPNVSIMPELLQGMDINN